MTGYQKIIDTHVLKTLDDGRMVLKLDRVWGHEITTPNAILDAESRGVDVVFDPNKIKTMIDHISPAKDTLSAIQGKIVREWSQKHQIEFLEVGTNGVCHAIIPEKGWILPGDIGIMGDSHTCTHGAFCAFAAGVGTTDLEAGIITGLWICPPQKVIRVNFTGALPPNVFAKDLILTLINKIGVKGATNAVLEFGGPVIDAMSMEARMTLTNMAVEAGATSGMVMVDKITINYLWPVIKGGYKSKEEALAGFSRWNSDANCQYAETIEINVSQMGPVITQNYSPGDIVAVKKLVGKKIDQVYIGSCTNGRLEDLRIAAHILRGKKAAVRTVVVPATPSVWKKANQEGLLDIFMEADCCVSNPSCGACLGMSCGVIAPGEVCVSTTNRNFPGRMGKDGMVHLASPATAAASALTGVITVPTPEQIAGLHYANMNAEASPTGWEAVPASAVKYKEMVAKQAGSKRDFSGKVFYLKLDNVDTDQIIPAKYLTETDKKEMGKHCLEDAPIGSAEREKLYKSKIIVTGENFGCGSSREHAPWALEAAGISCVIAPSFARIFYNNMFNNGLLCIELPIEEIDRLFMERPAEIKADLEAGSIEAAGRTIKFKISGHQKELIRDGGSIGAMIKLAAEVG